VICITVALKVVVVVVLVVVVDNTYEGDIMLNIKINTLASKPKSEYLFFKNSVMRNALLK